MCCFAQAVLNVSNTCIFARLTDQRSQFLAYQMEYESRDPNAMILPLPVQTPAREDSVQFVNLEEYEKFFDDLAKAFPYQRKRRGWGPFAVDAAAGAANLAVHQVGNFIASFVPTMDDFDRLDKQFVIPNETWAKIPAYADYGFAVFQLKDLAGKPHPMAFKFQTRMNDLFFPTVHIHDGQVHSHEDFDHRLYMQHAGFDSVVGKYVNMNVKDRVTGLVRSKDVAGKYCNAEKSKGLVAPDLLVHRVDLQGKLENKDMTYFSAGSPTIPGINIRKLARYSPLAIPIAAVVWFINRRNQLRTQRIKSSILDSAESDGTEFDSEKLKSE